MVCTKIPEKKLYSKSKSRKKPKETDSIIKDYCLPSTLHQMDYKLNRTSLKLANKSLDDKVRNLFLVKVKSVCLLKITDSPFLLIEYTVSRIRSKKTSVNLEENKDRYKCADSPIYRKRCIRRP